MDWISGNDGGKWLERFEHDLKYNANRCFKKQREAKSNLINEKSTGTAENDADSDTDEYEIFKIEVVNSLYIRKKPSLMRVHTNGHGNRTQAPKA